MDVEVWIRQGTFETHGKEGVFDFNQDVSMKANKPIKLTRDSS